MSTYIVRSLMGDAEGINIYTPSTFIDKVLQPKLKTYPFVFLCSADMAKHEVYRYENTLKEVLSKVKFPYIVTRQAGNPSHCLKTTIKAAIIKTDAPFNDNPNSKNTKYRYTHCCGVSHFRLNKSPTEVFNRLRSYYYSAIKMLPHSGRAHYIFTSEDNQKANDFTEFVRLGKLGTIQSLRNDRHTVLLMTPDNKAVHKYFYPKQYTNRTNITVTGDSSGADSIFNILL